MVYKDLKKSVEEIKMSEETKKRIIRNCYLKISDEEEYNIKKTDKTLKKLLPLVAVTVICVISAGVVIANHLRGFKDVTKGTAIIGEIYEETTEMVKLNAEVKDNLIVSAEFVDYTNPPYSYQEVIDINSYEIIDSFGKTVKEGSAKSISAFENGKVDFAIPLNDISAGEYKLIINEFVGSKKAEQNLPIKGVWKCFFVK